ncbi:hypothetical protein HK101_011396, partial [Irineochytrium annulatum]
TDGLSARDRWKKLDQQRQGSSSALPRPLAKPPATVTGFGVAVGGMGSEDTVRGAEGAEIQAVLVCDGDGALDCITEKAAVDGSLGGGSIDTVAGDSVVI